MAPETLRPPAVIDTAIKLFTGNFRVLATCVLVVALPLEVLDVAVRLAIDPDALRLSAATTAASAGRLNGPGVVTGVLQALTLVLGNLACCTAISDAWLGRAPQAAASLRVGLSRVVPALGLAIVLGAALFAGLVALVVPAIWLAVAFSLAGPALVLERLGPLAALGRSYGLVGGRWWVTFATYLLAVLLAIVLLLAVGIVLGLFAGLPDSVAAGAVANVVVGTVVNVLLIPLFAAVAVGLYHELRGGRPEPEPEPIQWLPPIPTQHP